ncbi:hypothetical protein [Streptomyces uncialis]|uniref:hypothetical protein n=1 Tax=Streptomyces uncialis TaxID=1048205 RepID=UPI00116101AD|nr:hypothetical protein [Streptomyces uncialis]
MAAAIDVWLTEPAVRAQKSAEKKLEDSKEKTTPPFVIRIREEDPGDWPIYVLDRLLTEEERRKLAAFGPSDRHSLVESRAARRYLDSIGAKLESSHMTHSMTFFSEKKSPVSITNMHAKKVRCTKPKTVTIIHFITQGNSSVSSVNFELSEPNPPAMISDSEDEHNQQPYFNHHRIDLGASQTPGGLRVTGVSQEMTCEWNIQAEYRNTEGVFKTTIEDSDGDPFIAVGLSRDYQEYWTRIPYDGGYWQVCKSDGRNCVREPK